MGDEGPFGKICLFCSCTAAAIQMNSFNMGTVTLEECITNNPPLYLSISADLHCHAIMKLEHNFNIQTPKTLQSFATHRVGPQILAS